ncbi:DNA cytosine methyltransferase [Ruminococcus albus]|uniref:Cytosine-specific methyltransferase n=1 Tax=Ruminococcus albus TaxID=1264 RepID=A0A1I1FS70_RUMAL|nr:DNA cytosine methyltransferase [Ruminococcus albus]SFC00488.1 DNA (cytosine-5)-methyltransferase 1 [Ruminococcus albus]
MKKYNIVDLFSGAGGFQIGFERQGFKVLLSTDFDADCENVHKINRPKVPFLKIDIHDLDSDTIDKYVKKGSNIDVLIGGPPCQGFSTIGKRISSDPNKRTAFDPRNTLFREYIRILRYLQPKFFLMENVEGLLTRDKGRIFAEIKKTFAETGYDFNYVILNAADYGVPQIRNRVFFYGNRVGVKMHPPTPQYGESTGKPYKTVGEAISDLADKGDDPSINHVALKHGAINIRRYSLIPEGGRLPEDNLPPELYRKNFGNTFKRLHRNKPSLTMVPGHNAFPIHPWLNRSLTVREAARIQTFPDSYIFAGPRQKQCMQVGNAVPPLLAEVWAKYLREELDKYYARI